jgi:signal transduction histidine kinase
VKIRLLHTEGFRVTAIFAAILVLSAAVLGSGVIYIVDEEFQDQIIQFAGADIAAIEDGYRTEGVDEAREVIAQRMAAPGASDFFLLQKGAVRLAGNMPAMPPREGVQTLPYPGSRPGHAVLGLGAFVAPDLYVFSGSDLFHARLARTRILRMLFWVLAATLLLAALGGYAVSRNLLKRTDAIAKACGAIMAGNLKTRIPLRGTEDELDRLAGTINAMLDRIAALMENLRQVTNDIAHDLRTPLTHLRHRLERTRGQAATTADYDQALETAIAASDEILALFAALLRIAQIEGGVRRAGFAPVDLAALLHHLKDVFGAVAEDADHRLEIKREEPVTIRGDRELLIQLFSNLIENAIMHTPRGTHIALSLTRQQSRAVISVSDDGPGVPQEEHARLFQRLYRREVSRTAPGYGLGLALAAAVAELHGGNVTIEPQSRDGFSIAAALPLND